MADLARILLACIRLVNGLAALVVPQQLARGLGIDPEQYPAAMYVLRMFGMRTVLIGLDLLAPRGERREQALKKTLRNRPDLLAGVSLSEEDKKILERVKRSSSLSS